MKILVDLHGFTRTFELDHWQENTTLSDLILAAGGPYIAPDDPLYLRLSAATGRLAAGVGGTAGGECHQSAPSTDGPPHTRLEPYSRRWYQSRSHRAPVER